jgi:hypothetical protein
MKLALSSSLRFFWLIYSLFLLILIALQQWSIYCQIGLTNDSLDYLAAAHSFAEKGILLDAEGRPMVVWTPLFPVILSFFDPYNLWFSPYFNAICLWLTTWIWAKIIRITIQDFGFQIWCLAVLMLNIVLPFTHSFLWSEPLFLSLSALSLYSLLRYFHNSNSTYFFLLVFFSFWMALQRNAGILFIAGITLGMLSFLKPTRILPVISFAFLAGLGWLSWTLHKVFFRNELYSDFIFQFFYVELWFSNLLIYADAWKAWFLPRGLAWSVNIGLSIGVLIGIILRFPRPNHEPNVKFLKTLFLIFLIYTAGILNLLGLESETAERYSAPLYPLVCVFFTNILAETYQKLSKPIFKSLLTFALIGMLAYPLIRTFKNVSFWHEVNCKKKKEQRLQ